MSKVYGLYASDVKKSKEYQIHMEAIIKEKMSSKYDFAPELASRDIEIKMLRLQNEEHANRIDELEREVERLELENNRLAKIFNDAPDIDFAFTHAELAEYSAQLMKNILTDEIVAKSLQTEWTEWCEDTGCIPSDFDIKGDGEVQVSFTASVWAEKVAEYLRLLCIDQLTSSLP